MMRSQKQVKVIPHQSQDTQDIEVTSFQPSNKLRASWTGGSQGQGEGRGLMLQPSSPLAIINQRRSTTSKFTTETFIQIDNLMNECKETVPNLIGKSRKVRLTNDKLIMYQGYKTKELIGRKAANFWKQQIHKNNNIIKVLNENKLHEEVEEILAQQKI